MFPVSPLAWVRFIIYPLFSWPWPKSMGSPLQVGYTYIKYTKLNGWKLGQTPGGGLDFIQDRWCNEIQRAQLRTQGALIGGPKRA